MPKKLIPALTGRTIRCLLFDLGDTLWSRKDMVVWQRLENVANLRAVQYLRTCVAGQHLRDISDETLGKRLRDTLEEHLRDMIRREPDLEPDKALTVVQVLRDWGIQNVTVANGEAIFEALRIRIPESRPLFDDVLSTLETLKKRGFLLGIVSNRHWGGKLFQEDLQTLGLLEYFELRHSAISVDLGIRKPNPAIFLHALTALDVTPQEAAMVGDSLLSDIAGGKMLGLFTVWKPKPSVRLQNELMPSGASSASTKIHQASSSPAEISASERPDDLPEGMHITDDDYVLAQVQSRAGKWDDYLHSEVKPDLIIENLSDLLDVFIEVGEQ